MNEERFELSIMRSIIRRLFHLTISTYSIHLRFHLPTCCASMHTHITSTTPSHAFLLSKFYLRFCDIIFSSRLISSPQAFLIIPSFPSVSNQSVRTQDCISYTHTVPVVSHQKREQLKLLLSIHISLSSVSGWRSTLIVCLRFHPLQLILPGWSSSNSAQCCTLIWNLDLERFNFNFLCTTWTVSLLFTSEYNLIFVHQNQKKNRISGRDFFRRSLLTRRIQGIIVVPLSCYISQSRNID
jgi:hypothetical protein